MNPRETRLTHRVPVLRNILLEHELQQFVNLRITLDQFGLGRESLSIQMM